MTRLQWIVLVVTLAGLALVLVFPPWVEVVDAGSSASNSHPHCCFDTPIWERPQANHDGETVALDRRRLALQLSLVALPGFALFLAAGRLRPRTRS